MNAVNERLQHIGFSFVNVFILEQRDDQNIRQNRATYPIKPSLLSTYPLQDTLQRISIPPARPFLHRTREECCSSR